MRESHEARKTQMSKPLPIRTVLLFGFLLVAIAMALGVASHAKAQVAAATQDKPFVIEYYYKTKWGHTDEFLTLFRKNHKYGLKKKEEGVGGGGVGGVV